TASKRDSAFTSTECSTPSKSRQVTRQVLNGTKSEYHSSPLVRLSQTGFPCQALTGLHSPVSFDIIRKPPETKPPAEPENHRQTFRVVARHVTRAAGIC